MPLLPVASVCMERMVVMMPGSGVSMAVTLAAQTGARCSAYTIPVVRRGESLEPSEQVITFPPSTSAADQCPELP